MKTSKRILSFFMAVVMALTACSAGFVAFARETNPKDNNPFSAENASAEKSTDALNELLDSLLPTILDAIGDESLAKIGIDKEKVINASFDDKSIKSDRFYEFISELSVFLYPLISGGNMSSVLNSEGLSSGNDETDAKNYAYLEDKDAAKEFWGLYKTCKDNAKADGTEFQKLCYNYYNGYTNEDGKEIIGLKDLLFARNSVSTEVNSLVGASEEMLYMVGEIVGYFYEPDSESFYMPDLTPAQINDLITAYEAENGKIPLEAEENPETGMPAYNLNLMIKMMDYAVKFMDPSLSCTTIGEAIYYLFYEEAPFITSLYNRCLVAGGYDTGYDEFCYTTWFEKTSKEYSYADFLKDSGYADSDLPEAVIKGLYRQELGGLFMMSVLPDGNMDLSQTELYVPYISGLVSALGYCTADEAKAGIESNFLTEEDIDYILSNPTVAAYENTMEQPAFSSQNSMYNLIAFDVNHHGFSHAVQTAFKSVSPSSTQFRDFFNALVAGDRNAVSKIPQVVTDYTKYACEDFAEQYISSTEPINIFRQMSVDENINSALTPYEFVSSNYPIDNSYYFELTASTIDGYIDMAKDIDGLLKSLTGMDLEVADVLNGVISALTQTKDKDGNGVTLDTILASVDGIYTNIAHDPVGTIANAVPLLVILVDELLIPLIFNGDGDSFNGFLMSMVDLLSGIVPSIGDTINGLFEKYGITSINFDLNYILPALTNYMNNGTVVKVYEGTEIPVITTIKAADEWIAANLKNCEFLNKPKTDEEGNVVTDENGNTVPAIDPGIQDLLRTIINVLDQTVNEYVEEHSNPANADAKIGTNLDGNELTLNKGFNNLGVALPTFIDAFVKNLLSLYSFDTDWSFKSRIAHSEKTITFNEVTTTYGTAENVTLSDVKEHIFDTGSDRDPANVTSWIVNLIVSDWLNAVIDLLNDVFTTDNDITNNIPIIAGLLNALGGFSETSIITDALNGLFYLTRSSQYSFTFSEQAIPCTQNNETYVGLSDDSAYYLIANIGPIIEIVMNIVNASKAQEPTEPEEPITPEVPDETPAEDEPFDIMKTLGITEQDINDVINEVAKLDTKENVKKTQDILDKIDKMISTILENTYLNGYSVDKLDGILSGALTYLINHFGKDTTDEILKVVTDYLNIICNESINQNWAPKRNGAANGPVNAKKVYSNKQLSILVTETYALLEEILDKVINIAGDDNDYIVNAIDGIFSPSSIGFRAGLDKNVLDNLTWCEVSATKYATDLGYTFSAGDKDGFYNNLFASLAPVTAILGALLGAETTGYYDNVLSPIFASICDAADIELYTPKDNSNAELALATFKPIADLLNKFLAAPTNTLISLVNGISGVLEDKTVTKIINGAVTPIAKELGGLHAIIAVLSPSLADSIQINGMTLADLSSTISSVLTIIPKNNVVVTLINLLLGTDIPYIDFGKKLPNGEIAFVIFAFALGIVLKSDTVMSLIPEEYKAITDMLQKISVGNVLNIIDRVLSITKNPTEVYWTFEDYLAKETNSFKYPSGISASKAEDAVDSLDNIVKNIFPLLKSLDVLDYDDLTSLVNGMLFKNEILTKMASAIYGALGMAPSALADYLVDRSYGNTYSYAAAALRKCSSWNQVSNINWGFKDGSAKAEQGFINGLAAVLRPANDLLAILLAEGELNLAFGDVISNLIATLKIAQNGYLKEDVKDEDGNTILDENGNPVQKEVGEYSIVLRDGMLNIYIRNGFKSGSEMAAKHPELVNDLYNRIEIDLNEIVKLIENISLYGGNGYESAIIPLLEAFMCDGVKSYDEYIKDYNKAKDNLIIDILNPLFGFVDKALANPFDTITAVLPNLAYFIDNNGIAQLLNNLLSPITHNILDALTENNINIDDLLKTFNLDLGKVLCDLIERELGAKVSFTLKLSDLNSCNIQDALIPLVNGLLKHFNIDITLPDFKWSTLASHGTQTSFNSAAGGQGIRIIAKQGETLVAVLRYIADVLISNANEIKTLICTIPDVAKNKTIVNILTTVFNQIAGAHEDDIVKAVFYLLTQDPQNSFFDYRDFKFKDYDFSYPSTVDVDFLTTIGPMLDGLIGGLVEGGLTKMIGDMLYKDDIISSLVCGLYGAVEGVKINDNMNLAQLLAQTDIDFTTANVAKLLTDKDYGQSYASVAKVIEKAGSWSKVNKDSLHWGVTDRDSFVHALCAALRPIYGVLDVLLNDGSLGLFKLIYLPGSDGYTSAIVPLMEAFGLYNIKTQYQYRQDMSKEYDAILLDILNPLLDKVEDILNAPLEMLCDILPNLSLFFANDGLLQLIDNLLLPITALLDSLKPIVDVNDLLKAVGLDIEKEIKKLGIAPKGFKFDIYNLSATLKPLIGADNIVSLLNSVLGLIKIGGSPLGIKLMPIDWYQLASHGELITDEPSQAATFGARMYVKADQSEVLIAVLRYLVNTINYENNFDTISNLIGGLLGDVSDSVSDIISQVLGMLTGETDEVISSLCDLLQTLA